MVLLLEIWHRQILLFIFIIITKLAPTRHILNDSSGLPNIHCGCSDALWKF